MHLCELQDATQQSYKTFTKKCFMHDTAVLQTYRMHLKFDVLPIKIVHNVL